VSAANVSTILRRSFVKAANAVGRGNELAR